MEFFGRILEFSRTGKKFTFYIISIFLLKTGEGTDGEMDDTMANSVGDGDPTKRRNTPMFLVFMNSFYYNFQSAGPSGYPFIYCSVFVLFSRY